MALHECIIDMRGLNMRTPGNETRTSRMTRPAQILKTDLIFPDTREQYHLKFHDEPVLESV